MNLRDQLLKAGLASKKQARKASNDARLAKKKNKGGVDQITREIEEKKELQRKRDRELNRQKELEKQKLENTYRARQIMLRNNELVSGGSQFDTILYYFIVNSTKIHSIRVTDQQQTQLEFGSMGVVRLDPTSTDYCLLSEANCKRIYDIDPELVVCLHPKEGYLVSS